MGTYHFQEAGFDLQLSARCSKEASTVSRRVLFTGSFFFPQAIIYKYPQHSVESEESLLAHFSARRLKFSFSTPIFKKTLLDFNCIILLVLSSELLPFLCSALRRQTCLTQALSRKNLGNIDILPLLKLQNSWQIQFCIVNLSLHEMSRLLSEANASCFVFDLTLSNYSRTLLWEFSLLSIASSIFPSVPDLPH